MLSILVACAANGVIGNKNDLPWHLPADLKRFKSLTMGHSVIMGRKTFESILARIHKPLPGRTNIVVTRNHTFKSPSVKVVHSLDEAFVAAKNDGFVIGGAQLYQQALPKIERLYVTEVRADIEGDTYFPNLDYTHWQEVKRENHKKDDTHDYNYDFVVYDRK